jgi:SNF2 family DNA or RNA helicase
MYNIACIIRKNKHLGYLLLPYVVEGDTKTDLRARNLFSTEQPPEKEQDIDWAKLHKLAHSLDQVQLMRKFSKTETKTDQFFLGLSNSARDQLLFPYVWQQTDAIIKLAHKLQIPIYTDTNWPLLSHENLVYIEEKQAKIQLHFKRISEGTEYRMQLMLDDVKHNLQARGNKLLCINPCYLLVENKLINLHNIKNGKLLLPFLEKPVIHIPKRIEKQYFDKFIQKVANHTDIVAEGFEIIDLDVNPCAQITIEQNWIGNYGISLAFDYGERLITANNRQISFTKMQSMEDGFVFKRFKRDFEWEAEQIILLKQFGLQQQEAFFVKAGTDSHGLNSFLESLISLKPKLEQNHFRIVQNLPDNYLIQEPHISTRVEEGMDWFDLHITIKIGEVSMPFISLKNHILNHIKKFQLTSGEWFLIPDEWFEKYTGLCIHGRENHKALRIAKHHYTLLEQFQKTKNETTLEASCVANPPNPILKNVSLRSYQLMGFRWLHHLTARGFGAILADDMGLGKTLQTIALLTNFFDTETGTIQPKQMAIKNKQLDLFGEPVSKTIFDGQNESTKTSPPALIVMPASLVHNWENEITRFSPFIKTHVYAGDNREMMEHLLDTNHLILTTYGILRNDIETIKNYHFSFVILDESQAIKNPNSKTAQAVFTLQAKHKIALTGTPIENNLNDLWAQMHFVNPGLLGGFASFNQHYVQPIKKQMESSESLQLKSILEPFVLRRTKEQVAPELPPLTEITVSCQMDEIQQKLYEAEKSRYRNLILNSEDEPKPNLSAILVLQALMKLRLIANHPQMAGFDATNTSGKFKEVTEQLHILVQENQKVLVFSSFVRHLKLFEKYCIENNFGYAMLTGETSKRQEQIQDFKKNEETQVFLISLKTGGLGLNLTEAGYVFLLDPWWNPAAEMQAISRAHRIGQDKKVFVYRFISRGSIEEKIQLLQGLKKKLSETFITDKQLVNEMGFNELIALLD